MVALGPAVILVRSYGTLATCSLPVRAAPFGAYVATHYILLPVSAMLQQLYQTKTEIKTPFNDGLVFVPSFLEKLMYRPYLTDSRLVPRWGSKIAA